MLERLFRNVAVAGATVAMAISGLFAGTSLILDVHDVKTPVTTLPPLSQRSVLYSHDGQEIGRIGIEDRQSVQLDDVPATLVDAVLTSEDQTFWRNPGIDGHSVLRAVVKNAEEGQVTEGGSTITQQLVKNRILGPWRDLGRKIKEAVLAVRLGDELSKRTVLTEYLNTVYFGQGAYGVQSAAERFFHTSVSNLDLSQSALLAGLISSPEHDNPYRFPERAAGRRSAVLQLMVEGGSITKRQAQVAAAVPVPSGPVPGDLRPQSHFTEEVQARLLADPRLGSTPKERRRTVLRGGLKIFTTQDLAMEFLAAAAMVRVLPDQPPFTAAMVVMEPQTGKVRAMVGGPGYQRSKYNLATHPPGRQTGSSFKTVTLAAALEAGYSPERIVNGSSPCTVGRAFYKPWHTRNIEGGGGSMTLREATANSVNCAYARIIADIGPEAVIDMAKRLGITQPIPNVLPITLGTTDLTPLEMGSVAATIAADGLRHPPQFVERVVDPSGQVLIDNTQWPGTRAIGSDIARCEADILRDVVGHGTGTRAQLWGHDVAGKTGTTDGQSDAWFLGFTPQLAGAVWMGAPEGRVPMTSVGGITVYGGTYPARIWQAFMQIALRNQPNQPFPAPAAGCQRPAPPPAPEIQPSGSGGPPPATAPSGAGTTRAPSAVSAPAPAPAPPPPAPAPAPAPRAAPRPPPAPSTGLLPGVTLPGGLHV